MSEGAPVKRGRGRPKGVPSKTHRLVPNTFYDNPATAETTVEKAKFAQMLMTNRGRIKANDGLWYEIKGKNLGAGIFRITLERTVQKVVSIANEDSDLPSYESDCLLISEAIRG